MVYEREKAGYLGAGIGVSLFLHGLLLLLFLVVWAKRPEPGGSGLVMDAFLMNGGDGFYQPGVPWGDFNAVPGKKGAPDAVADKPVAEKESDPVKPEEKKAQAKSSGQQKVSEKNRETAAVIPAVREKVVSKKKPVKKDAPPKKKVLGAATIKPAASVETAGAGIAGEGGTGTQAYGGAVGDAPGFGAGRGRGIGVGSGAGIGDIRAARYFVRLRRIFQRRLKYPEEMGNRKISGKALVRFALDADGKLAAESVALVETSGHDLLDAQALKTIREVPSLPAPPYGAMVIEIPIVFRVYH